VAINREYMQTPGCALCALGDDSCVGYLDHNDPQLRAAAIIGLLRSGRHGDAAYGRLREMTHAADPATRVAVAAAVTDAMLRLDREPCQELMTDGSEVARGIIQVLARRSRDRVAELRELGSAARTVEAAQPQANL
jgi:hypothetical protein